MMRFWFTALAIAVASASPIAIYDSHKRAEDLAKFCIANNGSWIVRNGDDVLTRYECRRDLDLDLTLRKERSI